MTNLIPASLFTQVEQSLVADRSDLYGYDLAKTIEPTQMVGFVLKEGDETSTFFLNETNRDVEGDIECWVFLPVIADHTGRRRVVVYND